MTRHTLPELGFAADALSPHISPETLEYHHGKHHASYVSKLNDQIEGTEFADMTLEDIVRKSNGGMFNNAAQHFNHSFYWNAIAPGRADAPSGDLASAIDSTYGSFASFRETFTEKCTTLFGSGWCWLVKKPDGSLDITQEANAGCPLTDNQTPLLTCDVWEHAYYIDFRNARPKYVEAFWKLVNWEFVGKQFAS